MSGNIRELTKQLEEAEAELARREGAYLSLSDDSAEAKKARRQRDDQRGIVKLRTDQLKSELGGGEWFDAKQNKWVSKAGYEVCQDHTGPRATCPYRHDGRRRG